MRLPLAVLLLALGAAPALGQEQTKTQQKCLTGLDKAEAKIAKAQAKANLSCLKDAGKGTLELFPCSRDDPSGKVAKAVAKLAQTVEKSCTGEGLPDFGISASGALQAAPPPRRAELGILDDVLSPNPRAAVVDCAIDKAACTCQQKVLAAADKLAAAERKVWAKCKKQALKTGGRRVFVGDIRQFTVLEGRGATVGDDLVPCVVDPATEGSIASEPKPVAKARAKLAKEVGKRCGVVAGHPFPGWCVGLAGDALATCLGERVDCRVCFEIRLAGGLDLDCDLFDDGQDNGTCPLLGSALQETVDIPSAAQPAETPGTAGVTVTNAKLITQFGSDSFDLNRARYTRYHVRTPPSDPPDAILVLIPGFLGGASGMKPLAENLLVRSLVEHGQTIEVWAFDRRSNQLEDVEGSELAETHLDPQIALDWLYGGELGLTLHPVLAAGPNRRAEFYNDNDDIAFLANWTERVFSEDIDAVVAAASTASANVFLGGHSAGTGFTARYAATDFDFTGAGPPDPGHARVRGLVLLEGGGGSTQGGPPSDEDLDRIEDRFDGGLFGAVRDAAPRCADGTTPCTVATEAVDCAGIGNATCVEEAPAYAATGLLNVRLLAASDPTAIQSMTDPDAGPSILLVDQGAPGNSAVNAVPDLNALAILPDGTAFGGIGSFLDDDGIVAGLAGFVATSLGSEGPVVDGLLTWQDLDESTVFPADDVPDNGPAPTDAETLWGQEVEIVRLERIAVSFFAGGTNFVDWYYPSSGLAVTNGLPSLDSSALSVGRGRRDIENLTRAAGIDVPVIAFGGSNGGASTPLSYLAFAQSIGPCAAPSCDGTPRVVDETAPSVAFPTFGDVAGGYEVHISEGFAHVDVIAAEDLPGNEVVAPLAAFIARNTQ